MMRLPLTVISGYLGAGKTTLINRILSEDHGLRLLVLVNDFGAINIDAALLASQTDDTIALTNGCVCCTMGADLYLALGDALDRTPRPDHLVVEASGIADPAAIANAAIAEPDLSYAGIITLVDGQNGLQLLQDDMIGAQVAQQITVADAIWVTKSGSVPEPLTAALAEVTGKAATPLPEGDLSPLLFDVTPLPRTRSTQSHPAYTRWQIDTDQVVSRARLGDMLAERPEGLYRLKGFVLTDDGPYEVHVVGNYVEATRTQAKRTQLVGLGPAARLGDAEMDSWWATSQTATEA